MLSKLNRLRKTKDFKSVYRKGRRYGGRYLMLYLLPNDFMTVRVGLVVSKKQGNAVVRNRIKRQIRDILQKHLSSLDQNKDLIFVAKDKIRGIGYSLVEEEILSLCSKAKILRGKASVDEGRGKST